MASAQLPPVRGAAKGKSLPRIGGERTVIRDKRELAIFKPMVDAGRARGYSQGEDTDPRVIPTKRNSGSERTEKVYRKPSRKSKDNDPGTYTLSLKHNMKNLSDQAAREDEFDRAVAKNYRKMYSSSPTSSNLEVAPLTARTRAKVSKLLDGTEEEVESRSVARRLSDHLRNFHTDDLVPKSRKEKDMYYKVPMAPTPVGEGEGRERGDSDPVTSTGSAGAGATSLAKAPERDSRRCSLFDNMEKAIPNLGRVISQISEAVEAGTEPSDALETIVGSPSTHLSPRLRSLSRPDRERMKRMSNDSAASSGSGRRPSSAGVLGRFSLPKRGSSSYLMNRRELASMIEYEDDDGECAFRSPARASWAEEEAFGVHVVRRMIEAGKNTVALSDLSTDEEMTYFDLLADIIGVAYGLADYGVGPGETIAFFSENSFDYVKFFMGCTLCGILPILPPFGMDMSSIASDVLNEARPRYVYCSGAYLTIIQSTLGRLEMDSDTTIFVDSSGSGIATANRQCVRMEDLIEKNSDVDIKSKLQGFDYSPEPQDPLFMPAVVSTRTSDRRGISFVQVSNSNALSALQQQEVLFQGGSRCRSYFCTLPMTMAYCVAGALAYALCNHHTFGFASGSLTPQVVGELTQENEVEYLVTHAGDLGALSCVPPNHLSSLLCVIATVEDSLHLSPAGRPVEDFRVAHKMTRVVAVHTAPEYIMCFMSFMSEPEAAAEVGQALPHVDFKIIHLDTLEAQGKEAAGELWVRGPQIAENYRTASGTESILDPSGYYHTGEIAYVSAEGVLVLRDTYHDGIALSDGSAVLDPIEVENAAYKFGGAAYKFGGDRLCTNCICVRGYASNGTQVPILFFEVSPAALEDVKKNWNQEMMSFLEDTITDDRRLPARVELLENNSLPSQQNHASRKVFRFRMHRKLRRQAFEIGGIMKKGRRMSKSSSVNFGAMSGSTARKQASSVGATMQNDKRAAAAREVSMMVAKATRKSLNVGYPGATKRSSPLPSPTTASPPLHLSPLGRKSPFDEKVKMRMLSNDPSTLMRKSSNDFIVPRRVDSEMPGRTRDFSMDSNGPDVRFLSGSPIARGGRLRGVSGDSNDGSEVRFK